ncbi:hypothetical protein Sango_0373500 [Sesamum angolense]|uniref:Uncharacterized protein n=1 Tax=Sesamum angolense TaxID=2727404 RepID=A0AAE1X9W6_9LAMI|nr:hypothetical protein Sango_0373500 [Sesamum angolense]
MTARQQSPDSPRIPPGGLDPVRWPGGKAWGFSIDPEMKRRKRIARYKVYSVEGRVKASIRNGLRWFKNKCSELIHGY